VPGEGGLQQEREQARTEIKTELDYA